MKLLDRLSEGFGKLGKAAGDALDVTRLQMDVLRARRRKDGVARDLGYLVFRVSQGATAQPGEQDALVQKISDIEKEIERLEREIREVGAQKQGPPPPPPTGGAAPDATPPPPPPPSGDGPAGSPSGTAGGTPPDAGAAAQQPERGTTS
jgi:hypothetical protein